MDGTDNIVRLNSEQSGTNMRLAGFTKALGKGITRLISSIVVPALVMCTWRCRHPLTLPQLTQSAVPHNANSLRAPLYSCAQCQVRCPSQCTEAAVAWGSLWLPKHKHGAGYFSFAMYCKVPCQSHSFCVRHQQSSPVCS
jgi:hypothetical protein